MMRYTSPFLNPVNTRWVAKAIQPYTAPLKDIIPYHNHVDQKEYIKHIAWYNDHCTRVETWKAEELKAYRNMLNKFTNVSPTVQEIKPLTTQERIFNCALAVAILTPVVTLAADELMLALMLMFILSNKPK